MTPLYLSQVRIDTFRHKSGAKLEFPDGPGVVVLSGANGLGKTSLIEAVEWALTGTVRRLEEVLGERLTARELLRRNSAERWFRVALQFAEAGASLVIRMFPMRATCRRPPEHRQQTSWIFCRQAVSDGTSRPTTSGSISTSRISTRKRQPSGSMMRTREERWDLMRTLAGADVLGRIRNTLSTTRASISALVTQAQADHALASTALAQWDQLLKRRDMLRNELRATINMLSPSEVRAELGRLTHLGQLAEQLPSEVSATNAQSVLAKTRAALEVQSAALQRSLRYADDIGGRPDPAVGPRQYRAADARGGGRAPRQRGHCQYWRT